MPEVEANHRRWNAAFEALIGAKGPNPLTPILGTPDVDALSLCGADLERLHLDLLPDTAYYVGARSVSLFAVDATLDITPRHRLLLVCDADEQRNVPISLPPNPYPSSISVLKGPLSRSGQPGVGTEQLDSVWRDANGQTQPLAPALLVVGPKARLVKSQPTLDLTRAHAALTAVLREQTVAVRGEAVNRLQRTAESGWIERPYGAELFIKATGDFDDVTGGALFLAAFEADQHRFGETCLALDRLALETIYHCLVNREFPLPPECETVSVNVTPIMASSAEFVEFVNRFRSLQQPEVVIELHEEMSWLGELPGLLALIEQHGPHLRRCFAIDDVFGTNAHSTHFFQYFIPHHISWLKFDKDFFWFCHESGPEMGNLMAEHLRRAASTVDCVIVEGVSNAARRTFLEQCLEEIGIDEIYVQGFGIDNWDMPR